MANQWLFTRDEVASCPSIIDGMSPVEERLRRAKGVNFIYQAGILLELPQTTLYVAGVFFHRFYMRFSMDEKLGIHHYVSSRPPGSLLVGLAAPARDRVRPYRCRNPRDGRRPLGLLILLATR